MKKITVIIQPVKYEAVKKKLIEIGVSGITVSNVEGYGYQKRKLDVLDGKDTLLELLPKVRIEAVLKDSEVNPVIEAVIDAARTGRIGDGKIFVSEVLDAVRIRTGERGDFAL